MYEGVSIDYLNGGEKAFEKRFPKEYVECRNRIPMVFEFSGADICGPDALNVRYINSNDENEFFDVDFKNGVVVRSERDRD